MSTIFDLSVEDLYSLAIELLPGQTDQLNPDDITSLRTRITEWLLLHNFSTLHKFHKSEEDNWSFPTDYACDSCRKKKEEHKSLPQKSRRATAPIDAVPDTPKPRAKSPEAAAKAETLGPVLAGDEFITFEVKDRPPKIPEHLSSKESERDSLPGYYSSATECLFAFGSCLVRPFRLCLVGGTRE